MVTRIDPGDSPWTADQAAAVAHLYGEYGRIAEAIGQLAEAADRPSVPEEVRSLALGFCTHILRRQAEAVVECLRPFADRAADVLGVHLEHLSGGGRQ